MPANEQQPIEVEPIETVTIAEGEDASAPCPPAKAERRYRHASGDLVTLKSVLIRLGIGVVAVALALWTVLKSSFA